MFEQVDAFSMLCVLEYIVVESIVRDEIYEDRYKNARARLKKAYKQDTSIGAAAVRGSDGNLLPPEKSVAPTYMVPDENGMFPGLGPPAG